MTNEQVIMEQQKGPVFLAPNSKLTSDSGKLPIDDNNRDKDANQMTNSLGGYYQNVTQKGKLMLPTALWVLIIIAGICFLSLLASLNKTMSALDTLVEIENEQIKHLADHHGHHERHSHHDDHLRHMNDSPVAGKLKKHENNSPGKFENGDTGLVKSVFEKFPFQAPDFLSMMPRIPSFSEFNAGSSLETPVKTKTIIFSSDGKNLDNVNGDKDVTSLLDSMLSQISDSFMGLGRDSYRHNKVSPDFHQQQPMINAKIDKLNVNINSNGKKHKNNLAEQEKNNLNSEDFKTIDDMVSKLVGPSINQNNEAPSIIMSPFQMLGDETIGSGVVHHQPHHNHHHHQHHKGHESHLKPSFGGSSSMFGPSKMSPLSDLLFQLPVGPSREETDESPMFGIPQKQNQNPMIITIGDDAYMFGEPKSDVHKPEKHGSQLNMDLRPLPVFDIPQVNEFVQPKPAHELKSQEDRLKDDINQLNMLSSLVESFKDSNVQSDKQEKEASKKIQDDIKESGPAIEFYLNGKAIGAGDKDKLSLATDEKTSQPDAVGSDINQFADLFSLFFGNPPKSSLVVDPKAPKKSERLPDVHPEENKQQKSEKLPLEAISEKLPTFHETTKNPDTMSSSSEPLGPVMNQFMVDDLIGGLLTSPQVSGSSAPVQIDAKSPGPQKELSTPLSAESKQPSARDEVSTKTSIILDGLKNGKTTDEIVFGSDSSMRTTKAPAQLGTTNPMSDNEDIVLVPAKTDVFTRINSHNKAQQKLFEKPEPMTTTVGSAISSAKMSTKTTSAPETPITEWSIDSKKDLMTSTKILSETTTPRPDGNSSTKSILTTEQDKDAENVGFLRMADDLLDRGLMSFRRLLNI